MLLQMLATRVGVGNLVSEEKQERNHEREQAGSFGKGETQNGVLEELSCKSRTWLVSRCVSPHQIRNVMGQLATQLDRLSGDG